MLLGKLPHILPFKGGPFVRVVIRSFAGYGNLSCSKWQASSASLTAKKVWALGPQLPSSGKRIQATHQTGKGWTSSSTPKGPFLRGYISYQEGIHIYTPEV